MCSSDLNPVDFGSVPYGSSGDVTLTLTNAGKGNVRLASVEVDDESVTNEAIMAVPFGPGGTLAVPLTWTPTSADDLDALLELTLQDDTGPTATVRVPLEGSVAVAELSLSSSSLEFGEVSAGCSGTGSVVFENTGSEELLVTAIDFVEPVDAYALAADGADLALPWTLKPGASRTLDVAFSPTTTATLPAELEVTSTDPIAPTRSISLSGTGRIDGEGEDVYITEEKNATVLVAVNASAVFSRDWEDSIPVLFETLGDSRTHWRVAFLTEMTGEVAGDIPYIDDTMSLSEALDAMDEQLANTGGDNDYLLQTFDLAIDINRDWLLDESVDWYNSTLNLIAMNNDVEQSTDGYLNYVNRYRAFKADPADVYVHAITGEQPSGCNTNGLFAEPSGGLEFAANETGGVFVSWCDDWATSMETIADAALSGIQRFVLTATPDPDSITVKIDDVTVDSGWYYDEDGNEILFEEGHFPALGSEVAIHYWTEHSCD